MQIPILFEDNSLIVVDKPAGLVVNRAQTVRVPTLQDWAQLKVKIGNGEPAVEDKDFIDRAGIVHRIDKETSGILLIAKTPGTFSALQGQFRERTVRKTYLAIVHGEMVPSEGEIRAPVGRLPWNRERFGIVPGGKDAVTAYTVQKNFQSLPAGPLSLVTLYPQTGRTHQIRVHLKYANHPIVGDYLYAGRKTSRSDRLWAPRVMLHAWKISFTHPGTGQILSLIAPIPDDMQTIIDSPHGIRRSQPQD